MKDSNIELIRTVLAGDETVTPELRDSILRACRQTIARRKLIGAKEVMEILQISRPTLRAYVKNGLLAQIMQRMEKTVLPGRASTSADDSGKHGADDL